MNELGRYLRRARRARKYTLRQVGLAVGKTAQHMSDIEKGRRCNKNMNPLLAVSLAEYLKIPVSDLFNLGGIELDLTSKKYLEYLKLTRNKGRASRIRHAMDGIQAVSAQIALEAKGVVSLEHVCEKLNSFVRELDAAISAA